MRVILINLIIFFSLGISAQNSPSTNPYSFIEPDFQRLIPFNQHQLKLIKDLGITRVEETWEPSSDTSSKYVYNFDDNGRIIGQHSFNIYDRRMILVDSVNYVYDHNNRLMRKKMDGLAFSSHDSIGYDSESRIIYYDCLFDTKMNDTVYHDTYFMLRQFDIKGDTVILIDKMDPDYPTKFYFHENTLIKVKDLYRTDSISISQNKLGELKKTYWFKNHRESDFKIGMIKLYRKQLLIQTSIFDMYDPNKRTQITDYYYSSEEKLMRVQQLNNQTFLVYDTRGLVTSKIEKMGSTAFVREYKYSFR